VTAPNRSNDAQVTLKFRSDRVVGGTDTVQDRVYFGLLNFEELCCLK